MAFNEDVIGKRVEILFQEENGGSRTFYAGTIQRRVKHLVKFDDGDEEWIELAQEQEEGHLKWISAEDIADSDVKAPVMASSSSTMAAVVKRSRSPETIHAPSFSNDAPLQKKIKMEVKTEAKMMIKTEVEEDFKDNDSSSSSSSSSSSGGGSDWPNSLPVPNPMPKSITQIIKLMDLLEPGQDYYKRQQDSRGECAKTRGKLRKFARKEGNKDHPAIKHWLETKDWQPPNQEALLALIELLKTMIKSK